MKKKLNCQLWMYLWLCWLRQLQQQLKRTVCRYWFATDIVVANRSSH